MQDTEPTAARPAPATTDPGGAADAFFSTQIERAIATDRMICAGSGYDFRERDFGTHNYGDLMRAIAATTNECDAGLFFNGYVRWLERRPAEDRSPGHTPAAIARSNIGWMFGEGMEAERRAMWVAVCGAAHPVFGAMETLPTPQEAYEAGLRLGEGGAR